MYDSVDAICLSASFDNFISYALTGTEGFKAIHYSQHRLSWGSPINSSAAENTFS